MPEVTTGDGVRLHYTDQGSGRPLVLLHGWTFSGRFFDGVDDGRGGRGGVAGRLAEHARVVTVDLRGHGDSEDPGHGYRVARLAADLRDLLAALDLQDAVVLGWSLGAPVIWSHLELFGSARIAGAVCVAQTPRQYYGTDWRWAHAECFDDAGLAAVCATVAADPSGEDRRQLATIRVTEPSSADRRLLLAEMAKCPVRARTAVMTDHTRQDWRDLLPTLDLPTLALVAEHDGVFETGGPEWVGEAVPGAQTVRFPDSGHALFLDEPDRFVDAVVGFLTALDDGGPPPRTAAGGAR